MSIAVLPRNTRQGNPPAHELSETPVTFSLCRSLRAVRAFLTGRFNASPGYIIGNLYHFYGSFVTVAGARCTMPSGSFSALRANSASPRAAGMRNGRSPVRLRCLSTILGDMCRKQCARQRARAADHVRELGSQLTRSTHSDFVCRRIGNSCWAGCEETMQRIIVDGTVCFQTSPGDDVHRNGAARGEASMKLRSRDRVDDADGWPTATGVSKVNRGFPVKLVRRGVSGFTIDTGRAQAEYSTW